MSEMQPPHAEESINSRESAAETHSPLRPTAVDQQNLFLGPNGLRPGWRLFLYVGMGFLVFLMFTGLAHFIFPHSWGGLWAQMYSQFALAAAALVPGFAMAAIEGRTLGSYGLPRRGAFGKLFWAGTIWGVSALSLLMVLMRGVGVFSFGHLALHGGRVLKFGSFWGLFFLLVGFFEEFAFRGYAQFTLSGAVGFWPAAFLLSLLFGALHLANQGEAWMGALCAGLIGLFFCLTLRRTGTLWFAVGMHASWDWGESFLYSVPDSGGMSPGHLLNSSFHGPRWLTGGGVGPEGSVLVFLVLAVAGVVFDRMYPARLVASARTPSSGPV